MANSNMDAFKKMVGEVYEIRKDYMIEYAKRATGSYETAEDIVQQVFLAVLVKYRSLPNQKEISYYLIASLRNALITHGKKKKKERISFQELAYFSDYPAERELIMHQMMEENLEKLNKKMSELKEEDKDFLLMSFSGVPISDIAEEKGMKPSSVSNKKHRLIDKIRNKFLPKTKRLCIVGLSTILHQIIDLL